jgi:Adenylate and Guanylate cyclase catalytic domain
VKTTGDGMLVEFASVVEAVRCAVEVQQEIVKRNAEVPQEKRIEFRIGINVGDIIIDGNDIFGDGVNVAARLEAIAEPSGILISCQVYDQIEGKLALRFRRLGLRDLKNIAKPAEVYAIDRIDRSDDTLVLDGPEPIQEIKYCRAFDGVRLAYAISGSGPILLKSANWMNHLEYDWESPIWRHVVRGLSREHTLIRYDARGNGMSDWDVVDLSIDAWVSDLETVVDAAGVSVAYAVRHPERVSHLVLYGGFALGGKKRAPAEKETRNAIRH